MSDVWANIILLGALGFFTIVILAAGIEEFAKGIEKYLFINISNILFDLQKNKQKSIKTSTIFAIFFKVLFHRLSLFVLVVSTSLWLLSDNWHYLMIFAVYIVFGFLINYSIKYSGSHTDNHFQNTESLYFEIIALFCLLLSSVLIPSDNVFEKYWNKIVPDFSVDTAYEPNTNNATINRSNELLTVPNMDIYSIDQFKKINFYRYINNASICTDNCNLKIVKEGKNNKDIVLNSNNTNTIIHKIFTDQPLTKNFNEEKLYKALNEATHDKQYYYLKTNTGRSNTFWIENRITYKEYWALFIATLLIVLVLIGSVVKILLIFNARRVENNAVFYANKIFNVLRYADSYHAYDCGSELALFKIKENLEVNSEKIPDLSVKGKSDLINKIINYLEVGCKQIKSIFEDISGKPTDVKDDEIIYLLKTRIAKNSNIFKDSNIFEDPTDVKDDEIIRELESLLNKVENGISFDIAYCAFVLYTIQDAFLPKYEGFSDDYVEQNLLPYSKTHRQITDIDFRDCHENAESINNGLHAGSLVDVDPHARLIKFSVDAVIYATILYTLIVLFTHQWLPTEAAVVSSIAAAIMYLNRDWLSNLIAGYVIWRDKLISLGEWIKIPEDGINGHVVDITQSNFKIANYNGTEVSMPIHEIINKPFQSFKQAKEQGHRIKRSFLIDIRSVRLTAVDDIGKKDNYCEKNLGTKKFQDLISKVKESVGGNQKEYSKKEYSNLKLFRKYMTEYLLDVDYINNNELLMVRELDLTEYGIPLEIYAFIEPMLAIYTNGENKNKCIRHYDRVVFEAIQSEIVEHVIWASRQFDLRIFQTESDRRDA